MNRLLAILLLGLLPASFVGCSKDCSYRAKLMRNKVVLLAACVEAYKASHGELPESLAQVEGIAGQYLKEDPETAKACFDESWTNGESTFTSVTPREQALYLRVDPSTYYLFDFWNGWLNKPPNDAELLAKAKIGALPARSFMVSDGIFVLCRVGPKPEHTEITLANAASFMMPFTFKGHMWCD